MNSSTDGRRRSRVLRETPYGLRVVPMGDVASIALPEHPRVAGGRAEDAADFGAGYSAGLAEAERRAGQMHRTWQAQADRLFADVRESVEQLRAEQRAALQAASQEILDAVMALATDVVGRELALSASPAADGLRRALAELGNVDDDAIVAHLHPDDLETFDLQQVGSRRHIEVVPDRSVGRGGCVLESGPTTIDARIATALDRARQVLLEW